MSVKKALSLTGLLFCSVVLFSQGVYKPGLVVTNAGDTARGWIKYANWKINPLKIEFKTDSASRSPIVYSIKEIQAFEVWGLDFYKRAAISKDMRPVDPVEITRETTDSTEYDTVFLRTVVSGRGLNLYQFMDFKAHYYLQAAGDSIEELSYRLSVSGQDNNVMELNIYKEQLRKHAGDKDSPALEREITNARFNEKDLARIVIGINGKTRVDLYGEANKKSRTQPQFFASVGAGVTSFSVTGSATYEADEIGLKYKTTVNPAFSVGVDLLSPRNFNDFTFRIEVTGTLQSYKGVNDRYDYAYLGHAATQTYTIKQESVSPSMSALYNFRRTKRVRYYAGLGMAYNLSIYSVDRLELDDPTDPTNDYKEDKPLVLNTGWATVFLRAGVRLNRKFEIGLTGNILGSFTDYTNLATKPRTYTLKFVYFFL